MPPWRRGRATWQPPDRGGRRNNKTVKEDSMRTTLLLAGCSVSLLASLHSARADLILLGEAAFSAQGFGNANRLITVQAQGNETGSVFPLNGTVGGSGDVVSPLADNQKFGVPTLGQ